MADPQIQAIEKFFRSAVKGLEAASSAVISSRAAQLKTLTQTELRSQFKRRVGGVSVKNLPATGRYGAAAYVSIKPKFLSIFQDGGTIQGRSTLLIVRLPEGARLKFPRVGKKGWAAVYERFKDRLSIVRSGDGWLVLAKVGKKKQVPVYFLTRQVREKKRLNFTENAEKVGRGMADEIQRLLEGKISNG
jgi:hypothetical protein